VTLSVTYIFFGGVKQQQPFYCHDVG